MHRSHKVDFAQWQPQEPGRRRNDLQTNSYMPVTADTALLAKWHLSVHKEELISLKNLDEDTEVMEEQKSVAEGN